MARTGNPREVPVVLVVFNRPESTARVLERISHQEPRHLFVIADGPLPDHPEDALKVAATRSLIDRVDWPCEITQIYSEGNLGCRASMLAGLDQVFDMVPAAIILEDDCLPSKDFFTFSSELLKKYAREPSVFSVGGNIWEFPDNPRGESYFFSKYFSCWGWATWADRWKSVDSSMSDWPDLRMTDFIPQWADSPMEIVFWERVFDATHGCEAPFRQAWDYSVQLAMWVDERVSVRPHVNLVQNIGLTEDGTHTRADSPAVSQREPGAMTWPLIHPESIERSRRMDEWANEARVGGSLRYRLNTNRDANT